MILRKLVKLNPDGSVAGEQQEFSANNYVPSNYTNSTLVVEQSLPTVNVGYSDQIAVNRQAPFFLDQGQLVTVVAPTSSTAKSVAVNPLTEQSLYGNIYGQFSVNELVFQSTITPVIVNNYTVNGVSLDTYVPKIGSIGVSGEIGNRAAQFKGTYLDSAAQKAAGILLPPFTTSTSTPYFLLEGWIYFEQTPSNNYDPIIVTRSADGINNSTNDSFRLEYDNSSSQIQFHYSDSSYASAGYKGILNVSPSGISTGQWNHFAVAWVSAGGSAAIKTYWNGTSLYSATGLSGYIRNSTAPLMVGSGQSGDYPLKAWLEDIHIRMGGVTLALADYSDFGSTGPNYYDQDYAGDYTVYLLSMNGPEQTSLFPVDNLCRVSATATYINQSSGVLGTGMVTREQSSVLGLTLFSGVCAGFTATGGSGGRLFGMKNGGCMEITTVQQLTDLESAKTQRKNAMQHTSYFIAGATVMYGASGNSGDFPKLFSSGWTGGSFAFLPVQSNVDNLRTLYENITVCGYTGNTTLEDYYGVAFTLGTTHVQKLYQDVVSYRSDFNTLTTRIKSSITSAASFDTLTAIQGITATGAIKKIAQYSQDNGGILISPKAKATQVTPIPEARYKVSSSKFAVLAPDDGGGLSPPE